MSAPAITRERVAILKSELQEQGEQSGAARPSTRETTPGLKEETGGEQSPGLTGSPAVRRRQFDNRIHVEFEGQNLQLVVNEAPLREGSLYIRPLSGGPRRVAPASALKLRGFVDR